MRKFQKGGGVDKFDGYRPGKTHFIQTDFFVSGLYNEFHMQSAWGWFEGSRRARSFGINKRLRSFSNLGHQIDEAGVGKTDHS